jgi:hypothetical protein
MGNSSSARLTGSNNTIMGFFAGDVGNATDNVMIGYNCFGPSFQNWPAASAVATTGNTFVGSNINTSSSPQVTIGNNNSALGNNINMRVVGITNATAIGANTASTKSNQISMGNSAVTEVLLSGKLAIDINALSAAADGTPIVIRTVGGVKTITI